MRERERGVHKRVSRCRYYIDSCISAIVLLWPMHSVPQVIMLELAQHIQVFLHKHDHPLVSRYEEMVERQIAEERREREREEKERQLSRIRQRGMQLSNSNKSMDKKLSPLY